MNSNFGNLSNETFLSNGLHKATQNLNLILMSIGIAGNLLNIYGFFQRNLRSTKLNWYLISVAASQLIFCCVLFIDYIFHFAQKKFLHDYDVYTNMAIDFILHTCDFYVIALKLILSIDRLYAIKNPIKKKLFFTQKHTKALIFGNILIPILLRIPIITSCYHEHNLKCRLTICSVVPTLINIIPLIATLVFAIILVREMIIYYRSKSKDTNLTFFLNNFKKQKVAKCNFNNIPIRASIFNAKKMSATQKSHYIIIIVSSLWSVITSIPYYILVNFWIYFQFDVCSKLFNVKTITSLQIISSIFFNSKYCTDFFIYFCFYGDFKECLLEPFFQIRKKYGK